MGACPGSVTKGSRFVAQLRSPFHGVHGPQGMAHSRSAEAKPSEQGTRKSNSTNAAPSCQAENYGAKQPISG